MPALIRVSDGSIWDAESQPNPEIHGNESRNSFLWNCYHHKLGIFFQKQVKDAILRAISAVHQRNEYTFDGDILTLQNALYEAVRTHIQHDAERKQSFMLRTVDILCQCAVDKNEIGRLQKNKLFKTSVNFAHRGILRYDSDAFLYEDVRLQTLNTILKSENDAFWQDVTISKVIDICIFMMKEDIYYRPRWIRILQDICGTVGSISDGTNNVLNTLHSVCLASHDFKLTTIEKANVEAWH